uniref:Ovule protein n=1 Tax=Mesocestoides corti TaxID=53468 RepID=A0A5K3FY25_MESCO
MNKTGTTDKALLTNHKSEPQVRRRPSESTTLATLLIIHYFSSVTFSGWLLTLFPCHLNSERQKIG